MLIKNPQQIPKNYNCIDCDYNTCNKKDFKKHISTDKHKRLVNASSTKSEEIINNNDMFTCCCGKTYFHDSSYYRHKKTCIKYSGEFDLTDDNMYDIINIKNALFNEDKQQDLINYLLKENTEFKELMMEQSKTMNELAKKAGNNITSNVTNANTNNQFNVNMYLNETCKDAMNIMDFVNQLHVEISDLEETGRLGYAEGISKIFINGLKQIKVNDRPLHCSDNKRETIYIKNNNEWNKETDNKVILTNAIKQVANKNISQIAEWVKIHPDCRDSSSKTNDKYLRIVSESMSGSSDEEAHKNYLKIIKNIAKETVINKAINSIF